jgi:hypothetical protein
MLINSGCANKNTTNQESDPWCNEQCFSAPTKEGETNKPTATPTKAISLQFTGDVPIDGTDAAIDGTDPVPTTPLSFDSPLTSPLNK